MQQFQKTRSRKMHLLLVGGLLCCSFIHAQNLQGIPPVLPPASGMPPDATGHRAGEEPDAAQREMLAKQQLKRNEARQQDIVRDTDKLLALATELKSDVNKTDKNVLSIDVIKKAEQIEKLSKSIRDKMKN